MKLQIPSLSDVQFLNRGNKMAALTRFEEVILRLLQNKAGEVVTHDEIAGALNAMRDGKEVNSNSSEVLVGRIRRKGYPVQVVRNRGYILGSDAS